MSVLLTQGKSQPLKGMEASLMLTGVKTAQEKAYTGRPESSQWPQSRALNRLCSGMGE